MILGANDLVWVERADGTREPFSVTRLADAIRRATDTWSDAGDDVAEWIAAAVQDYGGRHATERRLTPEAIAEMVEAVLGMLGFGDWAAAYRNRRGAAEIRLDELVGSPATGFELAFYRDLDQALAGVLGQPADGVRVCGLRACVLRLQGAQRWGQTCRRLAEEIVHHVYARAAGWRPPERPPLRLAIED